MITKLVLESAVPRTCSRLLLESQINLKNINRGSANTKNYCQMCYDRKRQQVKKQWFNPGSVCQSKIVQDYRELHQEGRASYSRTIEDERRFNEINIQMLSKSLHEQVFPASQNKTQLEIEDFGKIKKHLDEHGLWGKDCTVLNDINFRIPRFHGKTISEHFENIAKAQISKYLELAKELASSQPPPMPESWLCQKGWTKYTPDGIAQRVQCPDCDVIVFDVEVCITESELPVMATAASPNAWYCWVSDLLTDFDGAYQYPKRKLPDMFIPLEVEESSKNVMKKLIVGHNVGFDRSYVKEQYFLEKSETMFLDTLSLHMCISGLTGIQRILMNSKKAKKSEWMDVGSLNNLSDVFALYTKNGNLDKSTKDFFVEGTLADIHENFQMCVDYCANDVKATYEIFAKIFPEFLEHAPHPVTFAGMLEMGTSYLPVDDSWDRYLKDTNETYEDLENEMKTTLTKLAEDSCRLIRNEEYKKDPWLWSLDWTVQDLSLKKEKVKKTPKKPKKKEVNDIQNDNDNEVSGLKKKLRNLSADELLDEEVADWYPDLPKADDVLYKRRQHMNGFPSWYRKLCPKRSDPNWEAGASLISPQTRDSPLMLRMTWDGYPLFFSGKYGWGYLVPGRLDNLDTEPFDPPQSKSAAKKKGAVIVSNSPAEHDGDHEDENSLQIGTVFPTETYLNMSFTTNYGEDDAEEHFDDNALDFDIIEILRRERETNSDRSNCDKTNANMKDKNWKEFHGNGPYPKHDGIGPFNDVNLPGVWYYKMPHKNGEQFRCGNPLGKDYLTKMEDGTLSSAGGYNATRTLQNNKMISFWRNAQKRICSQMNVYLKENQLDKSIKCHSEYDNERHYGAILPKVITAGTVTRRAVEVTWLTASNPRVDRVGSELKAMVRSPPGYCFVGADVDSQELWIAAILGDAKFAGIHGCTAFGWMTLQGKKSDGTDLHSKTAATIDISRDNAKILNYGRIYGAGQRYARQLLMQFNHRLTENMASTKADQLYKTTKGTIRYELTDRGKYLAEQYGISYEANGLVDHECVRIILRKAKINRRNERMVAIRRWTRGSESEMFNKLEDIAVSTEPRTPVLGCKISRSLDPGIVKDEFITSRLNWVVQSSAVDYLHLILVCMKWLFTEYKIHGRFCISIHDEVRYIVKEKDRYRAALALQITNLLTRSIFAYKLGMNDLPQSVAFFSAIDIDKVIRKEVTLDCRTPSNPQGLKIGHGIYPGEALDIYEVLKKTNGGLLDEGEQ